MGQAIQGGTEQPVISMQGGAGAIVKSVGLIKSPRGLFYLGLFVAFPPYSKI